ncbi:hypothetical protein IWW36_001182 [Coemansia brasiliensis]|uniref:C2H2-type domain-containing protein n=1 Tax=Coemansia brasiliensis TaxID=2650707 RepID=A0A9W8I9I2_9FUNG|nr:hypothetical protein IWW36_001182 [Coemansia brasiliensis]
MNNIEFNSDGTVRRASVQLPYSSTSIASAWYTPLAVDQHSGLRQMQTQFPMSSPMSSPPQCPAPSLASYPQITYSSLAQLSVPSADTSVPSVFVYPSQVPTPSTLYAEFLKDLELAFSTPQPSSQLTAQPPAAKSAAKPAVQADPVAKPAEKPGPAKKRKQSTSPSEDTSPCRDGEAAKHKKKAPYVCSNCGSSFTRPSSIIVHMRTHTGEKPFRCPYPGCDKTFSVRSNQRRHSRLHSNPSMRSRRRQSCQETCAFSCGLPMPLWCPTPHDLSGDLALGNLSYYPTHLSTAIYSRSFSISTYANTQI